jgi:hypothetical protein
MRRLRTHFEQVPLAVAKKILADELKKKQASELAQGPGIKNWKRPAQKKPRPMIEKKRGRDENSCVRYFQVQRFASIKVLRESAQPVIRTAWAISVCLSVRGSGLFHLYSMQTCVAVCGCLSRPRASVACSCRGPLISKVRPKDWSKRNAPRPLLALHERIWDIR